MPPTELSRRAFLKGATLAAGALSFPSLLRSQNGTGSPNQKLNIACIGVGGRGRAALDGLKVPLATDSDGSVCEGFGTWIEKSMYGRKYMGIDRATFLIERDGTIARIWRKVKVPGHAEEVLKAARELP